MSDFPIVAQLNETRNYLSQHSHLVENEELIDIKTLKVAGNWIAHKAMTVVCLPVNSAAILAGLGSAFVVGCVVGGFKIAVFAISLGNYKPGFHTGTNWLLERTHSATNEIFKIIAELLYDVLDIGYQSLRIVRWIFRRLEKGFEKANEKESGFTLRQQILLPHKLINDAARTYRIDTISADRPFASIVKHTSLSLVNIPVSCLTAVCAGVVAAPLFTAIYLSKAVLFAGTNIHIPIPTFAGKSIEVSVTAGVEAITDTVDIVRDVFVTMYKVSSIFHCTNILATARDVIYYIPEAIFD